MSAPAITPWWETPPRQPPKTLAHADAIVERAGELAAFILKGRGPLDRALRGYEHAHRSLGRNDRAILAAAVYGFARNASAYRHVLGSDAPPPDFLRLALAEVFDTYRTHPGIHEAVDRLRPHREEWARELLRGEATPEADAAFALLLGVPSWWRTRGPWSTLHDAVAELSLGRLEAPTTLWVNPLRATRHAVVERLRSFGMDAQPTQSPHGLQLSGRTALGPTGLLEDGWAEVQDEGSQLIAQACAAPPGASVLDFCAGAGGKTLCLAAQVGPKGRVVAHDTVETRLRQLTPRARRAGFSWIETTSHPLPAGRRGAFDVVLVDAPCSSTGTMRRNPDVCWRWREADIDRFAQTQREILSQAATFVRPGGTLVYATCSFLRSENQEVCADFLSENYMFQHIPHPMPHPSGPGTRLIMGQAGYCGDAFYWAKFARRSG